MPGPHLASSAYRAGTTCLLRPQKHLPKLRLILLLQKTGLGIQGPLSSEARPTDSAPEAHLGAGIRPPYTGTELNVRDRVSGEVEEIPAGSCSVSMLA